METLLLALALVVPPAAPPVQHRVDMALILTSQAASSIALGLTLSCTASGDCAELNPRMQRWLDKGPVASAVWKSAIAAGVSYAVWRYLDGWPRTLALAGIAAVNVWDAAHDIRTARTIQQRE